MLFIKKQVIIGQRKTLNDPAAHDNGQGSENFRLGRFFFEVKARLALAGIQVQEAQPGKRKKAVDQVSPRGVGQSFDQEIALQVKGPVAAGHSGMNVPETTIGGR
ncbi:MAG: hypothetical protein LV481_01950 [Methylacidiphilales bacterium]|nr:hypothetical protein [Candidatus Methylacidiphilales bacterium]